MRLILVHGIAQERKDPVKLKAEWIETLTKGLQRQGLALPLGIDVALPYYGDRLYEFARQFDIPLSEEVVARGDAIDDDVLRFEAEMLELLRRRSGITDAQVNAEYGANPKPKGPQNWEWVQAIARAIDRYGSGMTELTLRLFLRVVYLYVERAGVRAEINRIVASAITEEPCVVVGHSLGSVVAYCVLREDMRSLTVPLFVTVGSPLGIRPVRDPLRPLKFPKPAKAWYNAFDDRDVVALYPLDGQNFPLDPAIQNNNAIRNHTDNRHGIVGYLDDGAVAKTIHDALVA